jgi:dipeptidase E
MKQLLQYFIPYAAVTFSFDEYCEKVEERFAEVGHHIKGIHTFTDPVKAIEDAEAIVVGGGNTWKLVRMLHDKKLMKPNSGKSL